MASSLWKIRGLFLIAILAVGEPAGKKDKRQGKTVSPTFVYKKLRQLEKKYEATVAVLESTVTKLDHVNTQMNQLLENQKSFKDDPPCPKPLPGFHLSADSKSCYGIQPSTVRVNWTTAVSLCYSISPDAHLVSLETKAEHDFVARRWANEIGLGTYSTYWTSGYMVDRHNWHWTSSKKAIKYPNWIPTTNHNDDRFQCMAVLSAEGFRWGDSACWAPHMVICELDL